MSALADKLMKAFLASERSQKSNAADARKRLEARQAKRFLDKYPSVSRIKTVPSIEKAPIPKGYAKTTLEFMNRFPNIKNIKKAN